MTRSRIGGFYKLDLAERLQALTSRGFLTEEDRRALQARRNELRADVADHMIENVIGVFGLPLGVGLNFLINDREHVVPMVVEEPSIVAALSAAAKILCDAGGIFCAAAEPLVYGQVQIVDLADLTAAETELLRHEEEILRLADLVHPRMRERGGGARKLTVTRYEASSESPAMLVAMLLADTRDAMGANLINSMCEAIAPRIAELTGGRVLLRILSNLTDASLTTASCRVSPRLLASSGYRGEDVARDIVLANDFARRDPHRAATHNKGIMNGIDALAIATGNDWRAIEAGAHAYAARTGRYTALTRWSRDDEGNLRGQLTLPLQVGIVGGSTKVNPGVGLNLRMLGVESGQELGAIMGAVGLAQNFAALRALVTSGIQRGHMALHARSVVAATGARGEIFDAAVREIITSGDIKAWRAEEIVADLGSQRTATLLKDEASLGIGHGKIILLGEHAAVYGEPALAAPIPMAIEARVSEGDEEGVRIRVAAWQIDELWHPRRQAQSAVTEMVALIMKRLQLPDDVRLNLEIHAGVPRGMGLGGSAALAVACLRGISLYFGLALDDEAINTHAFACEELCHHTPSGVDNAVATFGRVLFYQRGDPPIMRAIKAPHQIPIVIGQSGIQSSTATMVDGVRRAKERNPRAYQEILTQIGALTRQGAEALEGWRLTELGELMNICHGLLNALAVSCVELEELVVIARNNGALGAKLTGSGGGGAVVALCPDNAEHVALAMRRAGYKASTYNLG